MKKITIAGAGKVGSTAALWCALKELGDIVLYNRTEGKAKGIALDISETAPIYGFDSKITGTGNYKYTKNSDVIVITAGVQRKAGMSRDDLLKTNGAIVSDIVKNITKYSKNAVLVIVSNPLDAMAYLAKKVSKFPKNRVIGMAGILDSSRFKSFIADKLNVSVQDVSALVLGGHGSTMIPLPGYASVNGIPLSDLMSKKDIDKIIERTRNAGAEIIKLEQSSAYISPGASVIEIVEAIIKDKKRVLPCAAYLQGEYGAKDIFMGVPVKIGANGIEEIIQLNLTPQEKREFEKSCNSVRETIKKL